MIFYGLSVRFYGSNLREKCVMNDLTKNLSNKDLFLKSLSAGIIFPLLMIGLTFVVPSIEIAWVMAILLFTIYLFAFEVVSVDVAAVTVMVLLGLTSLFAPVMGLSEGLVSNQELFNGFSSNAVVSIIAVMIIGAGLDKTGLMTKVAGFILNVGGTNEKRIIPIVSSTVGFISSFMQNVGAAALFIPVVSRISARSGIPMSRLLMPMGFCAILGGTVTMIGSSPLILLNDLILTSNQALPTEQQMETWSLFSVTPIGIALVAAGIIYFVVAGKFVLPSSPSQDNNSTKGESSMTYFKETYDIDYDLFELKVPATSRLVDMHLDDVETGSKVRIIATRRGTEYRIGPGALDRDTTVESNMVLGIVASPEHVDAFAESYGLEKSSEIDVFADHLSSAKAGIAEIVIPPSSNLVGKSARDVWMRKKYGISMVGIYRDGDTLREGDDIRSLPLKAGDTIVVHTLWDALHRLQSDRDFVVVTTDYPHEELRPQKVVPALISFVVALSMVLFTDIRLSVALLTGAMGMVLSGVLKIEEAYQAVSWKTVFLLASLIPLGMAVENSGTAKWIAEQTIAVVGDMPIWVIQAAIAVLATFFTLVMSNVGATVLLVPLAVNIAIGVGASPALFALTVALATSNSFLIPTHQVNALIMGPGGYRVPDYMKAGGIMTILFLVVMLAMLNLIY
jgi:di/tricarboxylate transporter